MRFPGMIVVPALVSLAAAHALAQTAVREIGSWRIVCSADLMTDKTSCDMALGMTGPIGRTNLFIAEDEYGPVARLVTENFPPVTRALVRLDRDAPDTWSCTPVQRFALCTPAGTAQAGFIARLTSAARLVVRITRDTGAEDTVVDLAQTEAALAEFRRLHAASDRGKDQIAAREQRAREAEEATRRMRERDAQAAAVARARAEDDKRCAAVGDAQTRANCENDIRFCLVQAFLDAALYRACIGERMAVAPPPRPRPPPPPRPAAAPAPPAPFLHPTVDAATTADRQACARHAEPFKRDDCLGRVRQCAEAFPTTPGSYSACVAPWRP